MTNKLKAALIRLDKKLDSFMPLLVLLLVVVILRLPNFFEPYWYGDEGIYLAIGNALRQGKILYLEIVDHKTPLIYYLAMVPHQLYFRLLLLVWMLGATVAFYFLSRILLRFELGALAATGLFVLFTTLPAFEGNIPNGELFVLGFVLWGGLVLLRSPFGRQVLAEKQATSETTLEALKQTSALRLFVSGVLFGGGLLTKVPALFDFAAFAALPYFVLTNAFQWPVGQTWQRLLVANARVVAILAAGFFTPLVLSYLFFAAQGAGQEYLNFGLLYNFHYSGSWQLALGNPILEKLFTFGGKLAVLAVLMLGLTLGRRVLTLRLQFLAAWFGFALFASLLSNRPYPHYFLQVVPPAALLLVYSLLQLMTFVTAWQAKKKAARNLRPLLRAAVGLVLLELLMIVTQVLNLGRYPTASYYSRNLAYLTGQIDTPAYYQGFNGIMADNYEAARIIRATNEQELFIWGTNPMLYALSNTSPTGRFTVSFHIHDLKAYDETLTHLTESAPEYIVVMNNETGELPGIYRYLNEHYLRYRDFEHFVLWKRLGD